MGSAIKVPDKIKVGYQSRNDTYTKKLAYIIYYDEKGVLRKQASWDSWRDKKIDFDDFENIPTEGFVLNKKAGGYSTGWNHRQTYCRVYDPRGFEFEITIPNLLYILENTNSIKGKGIEGKLIYAWDGKDLFLMPIDSPDFKEIQEYNNIVKEKNYIKAKDLIIGATYLKNNNQEWIYIGRFNEYENANYWSRSKNKDNKNYEYSKLKGKMHYFFNEKHNCVETHKSLGQKFIKCITKESHPEYAKFMEIVENKEYFSSYDPSKNIYINFTLEEFLKTFDAHYFSDMRIINKNLKIIEVVKDYVNNETRFYVDPKLNHNYLPWQKKPNNIRYEGIFYKSLEELFLEIQPKYLKTFLENGNVFENIYRLYNY